MTLANSLWVLAASHEGSPSCHMRVFPLIAPELMRALISSAVTGPVWAPFFM